MRFHVYRDGRDTARNPRPNPPKVAFRDDETVPPTMAFGNREAEAKYEWRLCENDAAYGGAGCGAKD